MVKRVMHEYKGVVRKNGIYKSCQRHSKIIFWRVGLFVKVIPGEAGFRTDFFQI